MSAAGRSAECINRMAEAVMSETRAYLGPGSSPLLHRRRALLQPARRAVADVMGDEQRKMPGPYSRLLRTRILGP
jgi:hypothetical protein